MNKLASSKLSSTLQRIGLAVLVVTALLCSTPVNKARAWAFGVWTGRPGAVTAPSTVYIGDLLMPTGFRQFTLYSSLGPLANRSPATSGAQIIAARYTVEKWNGSAWVLSAQTGMITRTITAGQMSYRFPPLYIQPIVSRGYFRITWLFVWTTTTGAALGSGSIVSNLTSEHTCVTPYRLCQPYAGFFRTGGEGTGTW